MEEVGQFVPPEFHGDLFSKPQYEVLERASKESSTKEAAAARAKKNCAAAGGKSLKFWEVSC